MDVYRILHPTNITLPKTKDLRTTHTFIKLHHPKKTHSMKWSDWMSTTCKVDKNYKTKTNELCVVFVCVDACRCLRVFTLIFSLPIPILRPYYVRSVVFCPYSVIDQNTPTTSTSFINYRRTSTSTSSDRVYRYTVLLGTCYYYR